MSALARLLLVVTLAGGAAFTLTHYFSTRPTEPVSEVSWLVDEFNLNANQTRQIEALHAAYRPICARHCEAIIAARQELSHAATANARTRAETELRKLQQICQASTRTHLEAVAAVMDPAQGQRYLDLITPRLSAHQHAEPFGLQ